ncbi:cysteine protease ATG4C isoform X1 [Schistocerca cancellata]|uniref:cysteine protease ATG4C isoform X1 n=2 Tax=Schistocerca cancellata TaxID=274614 RepID=UPI002119B3CD|nr:cysteine protease ATG4C isoform X1 [Schistocerca cancellata]
MNTDYFTRSKRLLSGIREDGRITFPQARGAEEDNELAEGEGKVKTKLLAMWYNMKYGLNVKMKTNFSRDSPVWLLGRCYHRKTDPCDEQPVSDEKEEGIESFKSDFMSRIWLTYRKEFPSLDGSNISSDCGWGCMLRSGQMLLAQALVSHFLGRGWRWDPNQRPSNEKQYRDAVNHRKIIKWFGDTPSQMSPLSIHTLVSLGEVSGKKPGDWYGPGSVAHLLKKAVDMATRETSDFEQLTVYVAQDCAVYLQDVIDQCEANGKGSWKSLILLIPVRLGAEKLNYIYAPCLTAMLSLDNCIGIIGGRPKHSLYFVGFQDDKLIHLDPHYCQEMVDVWKAEFPLSSFHCRSPRKLNLSKMDPSCCIGFYCQTKDDLEKFVQNVQTCLIPPHEKAEYPMFIFCSGRSRDVMSAPKFCIPDDSIRLTDSVHDSEDDFESEEFEVL